MSTAFIFGLLIALMLTGMPISIALGLTVLTFLFVMTTVPIEAVALKLFTGIESFEIIVDNEHGLIVERTIALRPFPAVKLFRDAMYASLRDKLPPDVWDYPTP